MSYSARLPRAEHPAATPPQVICSRCGHCTPLFILTRPGLHGLGCTACLCARYALLLFHALRVLRASGQAQDRVHQGCPRGSTAYKRSVLGPAGEAHDNVQAMACRVICRTHTGTKARHLQGEKRQHRLAEFLRHTDPPQLLRTAPPAGRV